jgi:hypothetical protein
MPERLILAEPRGFCAGVEMAIKALTWMTRIFDGPVYCYHEIVHNEWVVKAFERAGVVFVEDIDSVPPGAPVMLSAHGSSPEVVAGADARAAIVIDAVCPLVTKVHHEVKRMASTSVTKDTTRRSGRSPRRRRPSRWWSRSVGWRVSSRVIRPRLRSSLRPPSVCTSGGR